MIRFLALQVVSQDQYIASLTGRKEHSDESDEIPDQLVETENKCLHRLDYGQCSNLSHHKLIVDNPYTFFRMRNKN